MEKKTRSTDGQRKRERERKVVKKGWKNNKQNIKIRRKNSIDVPSRKNRILREERAIISSSSRMKERDRKKE